MKALRIRIKGDFNSFRVPYELKYQRTYFYPPKTTLIGLIGGSMGLAEEELPPLYRKILVSVIMEGLAGTAKDLWVITKFKDPKPERSIVTRELLYAPKYWVYFSPKKSNLALEDIRKAFSNPIYPTTLGRSDELAMIKSNHVVELKKASESAYYRNTVLPFDYRTEKYSFEDVEPSYKVMRLPRTFRIPTGFACKEGKRYPVDYKVFTHVYNLGLRLGEKRGWTDGERSFFMY